MSDNRQYKALLAAAAEKLRTVYPTRLALRACVDLDEEENALCFNSFGREYKVRCSDWSIEPATNMWHHLVILQYLAGANGLPPTADWVALRELIPGSDARAAEFERECQSRFERLGKYTPQQMRRICKTLGAEFRYDESADLTAILPFMPQFPIRLNYWFQDEEFPASGKFLVNAGVRTCLNMEIVGELMLFMARRMCAEGRRLR